MMKRDDPPDGDRSVDVSAADFRALFEAVSNWGAGGMTMSAAPSTTSLPTVLPPLPG